MIMMTMAMVSKGERGVKRRQHQVRDAGALVGARRGSMAYHAASRMWQAELLLTITAGLPAQSWPAGTRRPGWTTAPSATLAPFSTRAPSITIAPAPISASFSMVQL